MRSIVIIVALAIALSGCSRKAKNPPPAPTEITSDTVVVVDAHNARTSLDYLGMYKGTLPCADCAGIETSLQLSEGFSYSLTRTYLGKKDKIAEQKGTFSWNQAGNAILLEDVKDEPNQYFVGENTLTQLDLNGNKITGKLAESFVLRKIPEAQAAKTDAPENLKPDPLVGTKWKLSELNGKVVSVNSEKIPFIEFRTAGAFGASAGCNSIGGKYDFTDSKIRLFNVMATRMACADMSTESALLEAFESTDNFVRNQEILQLRKGGVVLAKFEAMP